MTYLRNGVAYLICRKDLKVLVFYDVPATDDEIPEDPNYKPEGMYQIGDKWYWYNRIAELPNNISYQEILDIAERIDNLMTDEDAKNLYSELKQRFNFVYDEQVYFTDVYETLYQDTILNEDEFIVAKQQYYLIPQESKVIM